MDSILQEKAKEEEGKTKDEENAKVVAENPLKPMFYQLPWEFESNDRRPDLVSNITKEVLTLGNDMSALLAGKDEQEYQFSFDMDSYVILAQIMVKFDKNLQKTRQHCVPDLIEEEEFWCNYFYRVECLKASMGLPNQLGAYIEPENRPKRVEVSQADEE